MIDIKCVLTTRFACGCHARVCFCPCTVASSAGIAAAAVSALAAAGIPVGIVTGGGTGTFVFEAQSGVYTEVQPGSYIFNDNDYSKNEAGDVWAHVCHLSWWLHAAARRDSGRAPSLSAALTVVVQGVIVRRVVAVCVLGG